MNKRKTSEYDAVPRGNKIVIIGSLIVALLAIIMSILLYCVLHFPSDSISNYPNTHWRCEKLELDFYVDDKGNITSYFRDNAENMDYSVYTAESTKGTYNELTIELNNKSYTDIVKLECFFQRVDKGVIYLVVHKWDTSVFNLDKEVVIDKYVFPEYKLILVDE